MTVRKKPARVIQAEQPSGGSLPAIEQRVYGTASAVLGIVSVYLAFLSYQLSQRVSKQDQRIEGMDSVIRSLAKTETLLQVANEQNSHQVKLATTQIDYIKKNSAPEFSLSEFTFAADPTSTGNNILQLAFKNYGGRPARSVSTSIKVYSIVKDSAFLVMQRVAKNYTENISGDNSTPPGALYNCNFPFVADHKFTEMMENSIVVATVRYNDEFRNSLKKQVLGIKFTSGANGIVSGRDPSKSEYNLISMARSLLK